MQIGGKSAHEYDVEKKLKNETNPKKNYSMLV